MKIFLGVTGASGALYGARLLQVLVEGGHEIGLCLSSGAHLVLKHEGPGDSSNEGPAAAFLRLAGVKAGAVTLENPKNFASTFASGSSLIDMAFVCPCSASSIAAMAHGLNEHLIHRVADVMLKEGRPLIVVPRETPLSTILLQNMLTLKQAGAHIVAAMPAFYQQPETIGDLIDFVVGKALDIAGLPHALFTRWGSDLPAG